MICRISILNDSKLSMARWTSCITLNSLYKVLSFADVQAFSIPTFWLALVHNSLIWPAKLRFSSMYTPSYFICSAFLMSWLSMFKVLSSFSASIFLGLTVRDWNFSSTKTTLSGPVMCFEPWFNPSSSLKLLRCPTSSSGRFSLALEKRPGDEVVHWPL